MAASASSGTPDLPSTIVSPKITIITFVILTFLFSSVFWYLTSQTSLVAENKNQLMIYAVGAMWGPTFAAVVTRLIFQRNPKGFGLGLGNPVWLALGILLPIAAGLLMFGTAWLRLASGSVWVAVLFHGFWNYFIQQFYPALTAKTDSGEMMLGEFGWFVTVFYVALALVFWHFRDRLPKMPAERV